MDQRGAVRPRDGDCDTSLGHDIGAYEVQICSGPTVYEATDPDLIVALANEVGTASSSPFEHTPGPGALLFYQVSDGIGFPGLIEVVKGPGGRIRIHF